MPSTSRRDFARAFGLSAAVYVAFALLRTGFRLATIPRAPAEAALVLAQSVAVALPWILLTPPLIWLIGRLRRRPGPRGALRTVATHLGLAVALSLVDGFWGWSVTGWLGLPRTASPLLWYLGRLDQSVFLYLFLAGAAVVLRRSRDLDALALRSARLESRLLGARLHVLSLQLHPHFLFNTLHVVSELVHREAGTAASLVRRLRALLDRSFAEETSQEIPLRDELALLEAYVAIQRVRFDGSLTVEVTADEGLSEATVPRLVLQPLLENAIRHGTSRRAAPGHVAIRCRRVGQRLVLEVEDDGRGFDGGEVREGLGLGNTRARLNELYGAEASLELRRSAGGRTLARVAMPLGPPTMRSDEGDLSGTGIAQDIAVAAPIRWPQAAAAVAIAWIGAALVGTHEDIVAGWLTGDPEPFLDLLRPRLGEALLWIPLTAAVLGYSIRLARAGIAGIRLAGAHLGGGLLVLALHLVAVRLLVAPDMTGSYAAGTLLYDLGAYVALASGAHAWTLGRAVADRAVEATRLERDLAAARLASLRWRLNPAFLATTLEAIAELAGPDPDRADELTGRLGELLRLLLASAGHEELTLVQEVEFLRLQLEVVALARGSAPSLETDLAAECTEGAVPAMLLQPLADLAGPTRIELVARRARASLHLTVRLSADVPPGMADVVSAQLATRLGREPGHGISATRATDGGVTLDLRLRWRLTGPGIRVEPELALAGRV